MKAKRFVAIIVTICCMLVLIDPIYSGVAMGIESESLTEGNRKDDTIDINQFIQKKEAETDLYSYVFETENGLNCLKV